MPGLRCLALGPRLWRSLVKNTICKVLAAEGQPVHKSETLCVEIQDAVYSDGKECPHIHRACAIEIHLSITTENIYGAALAVWLIIPGEGQARSNDCP